MAPTYGKGVGVMTPDKLKSQNDMNNMIELLAHIGLYIYVPKTLLFYKT